MVLTQSMLTCAIPVNLHNMTIAKFASNNKCDNCSETLQYAHLQLYNTIVHNNIVTPGGGVLLFPGPLVERSETVINLLRGGI